MFTGLIEDLGILKRFQKTAQSGKITVATAIPMAEIVMGESIAVNGVRLTVTDFGNGTFTADVSPESLSRTNLGQLQSGNRVNLERALKLSDRFGGILSVGMLTPWVWLPSVSRIRMPFASPLKLPSLRCATW